MNTEQATSLWCKAQCRLLEIVDTLVLEDFGWNPYKNHVSLIEHQKEF